MNEVLEAINQFGSHIDARFDKLEVRFDSLEVRFDSLEARLAGVETRLSAVEARLDRVEARLDGLEARFDGLERFVKSQPDLKLILTRQKAMLDEMRGMRQDIIMVKSATHDFGRVSVTEGEINALHEAVNAATERTYLLAARMDAFEQANKPER